MTVLSIERKTYNGAFKAAVGMPPLIVHRQLARAREHQHRNAVPRLNRILTTNPRSRRFTLHKIIRSLEEDGSASSLAFFSAAGMVEAPELGALSGIVTSAIGAKLVLGPTRIRLPRWLLKRKISRQTLEALISSIAAIHRTAEPVLQKRWEWVFHPAMAVALGIVIFLLGIAGATTVLGPSARHAAAAFGMALAIAERDGLVVMIAALAGVASLALTVAYMMSGERLWSKARAWLVRNLRILGLKIAAWFTDLEALLWNITHLRWTGVLLAFSQATHPSEQLVTTAASHRSLRARARRVRRAYRFAADSAGRQ